jgi:hypothetical protein
MPKPITAYLEEVEKFCAVVEPYAELEVGNFYITITFPTAAMAKVFEELYRNRICIEFHAHGRERALHIVRYDKYKPERVTDWLRDKGYAVKE